MRQDREPAQAGRGAGGSSTVARAGDVHRDPEPGDVTGGCGRCGAPVTGDARYCRACGNPVGDSSAAGRRGGRSEQTRRRWARPHGTRSWLVVGGVAVLVGLGILLVTGGLGIGGGSSSNGPVLSSGVGASAWPAGVETGFLAVCGRSDPPTQSYCGCALEHVEAHFSVSAYLPLAQQVSPGGQAPDSLRRVELGCDRR